MAVQYLKELMSIYKGTSKMDSYIGGKKINPIRYCKILNVSRNLHILG
jgi:hypothetical protein